MKYISLIYPKIYLSKKSNINLSFDESQCVDFCTTILSILSLFSLHSRKKGERQIKRKVETL